MTDTSLHSSAETIHVFRVNLPADEASRLATDAAALRAALDAEIDPGRAEVIDPTDLADIGLSGYLVEGLGALTEPVARAARRLDEGTRPVLILRPGATLGGEPAPGPSGPLDHLGSFPLEPARPAQGTLTSPSAEGTAPTAPVPPPAPKKGRRTGSIVALVVVGVFLLIVALVIFLAN